MPYTVTKDGASQVESPSKTTREAMKEIKQVNQGSVKGYIGEPPPSAQPKPPLVAEELTQEEKQRKSALQEFLASIIQPPTISSRTPPGKARQILLKKLSKMTLGELRRFWNKRIPAEVNDGMKAEIQSKWDDISP